MFNPGFGDINIWWAFCQENFYATGPHSFRSSQVHRHRFSWVIVLTRTRNYACDSRSDSLCPQNVWCKIQIHLCSGNVPRNWSWSSWCRSLSNAPVDFFPISLQRYADEYILLATCISTRLTAKMKITFRLELSTQKLIENIKELPVI